MALAACAPNSELAGSSDTPPLPDPVEINAATTHIDWGIEDGLPVCGGTLEFVDRFVDAYLDVSGNGGLSDKIRYFYVSAETSDAEALCSSGRSACERRGTTYVKQPADLHEVVHAIRSLQADARFGMRYFEEGWAQLHTASELTWTDDVRLADSVQYADDVPPGSLYDPSAHFLSMLVDLDSRRAAERFVDATADVASVDDLDSVSREVLGLGVGELEEAYADYPTCSKLAWSESLVACSQEPLSWTEADPEFDSPRMLLAGNGEFGCSSEEAVGPSEGRVWVTYTFDVDTAGTYELLVSMEDMPGLRTEVVSCATACTEDPDFATDLAHVRADLELAPGRYVLRQSRPYAEPGSVGFLLQYDG